MRTLFVTAFTLIAFVAPADAQRLSNESTPSPREMQAAIGSGSSDAELARVAAEAAHHPLGTLANPVRAAGPEGARAYLDRLRCADGSRPSIGTGKDGGIDSYGTVTKAFTIDCRNAAPGNAEIFFDLYHEGHVEKGAPQGFSLAAE